MKKKYTVSLLFVLILNLSLIGIFAQTYAPLPFIEHFDKPWKDGANTRDLPSVFWVSTPATTDSSWSRDDDGVSRGSWQNLFGSYVFEDAREVIGHSARFHTNGANEKTAGILDLYVDFSASEGDKKLSYYYINVDGTDYMQVFLSTDGGGTFNKIKTEVGAYAWAKTTIDLGTIVAPNGILRFKATADPLHSDIGLDEVNVFDVDVTPVNADFISSFSTDAFPATATFTDKSTSTPTSWQWDFYNDGTIDATTQNPEFQFTNPGIYPVKLIVANAYASDTIVKNIYIHPNTRVSVPFIEHFDSNWVNFNGIRDVPSTNWLNGNALGDNSWSREDDGLNRGAWSSSLGSFTPAGANGTSHSARFHSFNALNGTMGILDLNVDFTSAKFKDTLSCFFINPDGNDSLEVFISYDNNQVFKKINTQKVQANWTLVKIALGDITASTGILRFQATSDFGNSDFGIDEVQISGTKNYATEITTFSIPGQSGNTTLNSETHTISLTVPFGTSLTSVAATFVLSQGAKATIGSDNQVSETTQNDFTHAVIYTITAEDGVSKQDWTVNVSTAKNNKADIISFTIPKQIGLSVFDNTEHKISVIVPSDLDPKALIALFVLSDSASAKIGDIEQISTVTSNDFSTEVTYAITSEDGSVTQNWLVIVSGFKGIQSVTSTSGVSVFPNPSTGLFTLKLTNIPSGNVSVEVANSTGQKIVVRQMNNNSVSPVSYVDLTNEIPGVYYLLIQTKDHIYRGKLIKK